MLLSGCSVNQFGLDPLKVSPPTEGGPLFQVKIDKSSLTGERVEIVEGSAVVVLVLLSPVRDTATHLSIEFQASGSASVTKRFQAVSSTVTIPAGQNSATVQLSSINDAVYQGKDEDFVLTIKEGSSTVDVIDGSLDIRVSDNESIPSISVNDVSVAENSGTLSFTVTQNSVSERDTSFSYGASGGAAGGVGVDYTLVSGTGSIPAGQTSTSILVSITNDSIDEVDETFNLFISNPLNSVISDGTGVGTITDDDGTPSISVTNITVNENTGTAILTVSLSNSCSQNITVDYASSPGTAVGTGTDFILASGTLTITAGSTTANISATIVDDALDEVDETFNISLSNPVNATISSGTAVVTISDNDATPSLSIGDIAAGEAAGTMSFTITLSAVSGRSVTVNYAASGGTALGSGVDYTLSSGMATISAGSTTSNLTVSIVNDALFEASETFSISLSGATNASISDASADGTINDNDTAPTFSFSSASQSISENSGTIILPVNLSAAAGRDLTVDYAVTSGTAVSGDDYTLSSGTLTFSAGESTKNISMAIVNDSLFKGNRTVEVSLSNPGGGAGTIAPTAHQVTITDDDATKLLFSGPSLAMSLVCSGPYTVTVADASDTPVNVGLAWPVNLSGIGNGNFYSDPACSSSITSKSISVGTSSAVVYFKGTVPETLVLAASATNLTSATANLLVNGVIKTAHGDNHSCALYKDKTMKCWGSNRWGQGGVGTNLNFYSPTAVVGITDAVDIAASARTTCAVLGTGGAQCWGQNNAGQVGDNSSTTRLSPVNVVGLTDATKIYSNSTSEFFCALLSDGTAKCWGNNPYGQLGDGTTIARTTPVAVSGVSNITSLAVASHTVCASISDGSVQCWGYNALGTVGDGTTTNRLLPTSLTGLTGVTKVYGTNFSMCATINDGTTKCWGNNPFGMLGDGSSAQRLSPTTSLLTNAVSIGGGEYHFCATLTDKSVKCFGANVRGQLGGFVLTASVSPATVSGVTDAVSYAGGFAFGCATLASGYLKCWGTNTLGQLGNGDPTMIPTPQTINLSGVLAMALGQYHSCAIFTDGTGKCWGSNQAVQLGTNTSANQETPNLPVSGLTLGTSVVSGSSATCSILSNGTVQCWGYNNSGVFGDGSITSRNYAQTITAAAGASAIAMGSAFTCYVISGVVKCSGSNAYGQLGDGTTTNSTSLVTVSGITTATQIATNLTSTCALLSNNTVKCWGYGSYGNLGNGATSHSSTPVDVSGISNAVAIVGGGQHFCVKLSDNTVKCWGYNAHGNLGDNSTTQRSTPVVVSGLTNVSSLGAGTFHTCSVLSDTTVKCWGRGTIGQVGDGYEGDRLVPMVVTGLSNVAALYSGPLSHTMCARLSDNTAKCWGNNDNGQLVGDPPPFSIISVLGL